MVSNVIPLRLKGWTLKEVTQELKKGGYAMPLEVTLFIMTEVARLSSQKDREGESFEMPMSPDQIFITPEGNIRLLPIGNERGKDLSPIESWGRITWELLTSRPFAKETSSRKPSYFNPKVSKELDTLVMRALSKKTKGFSVLHHDLTQQIEAESLAFEARFLSGMLQELFEEESQTVAG